jgi:hypothetical protein
VHCKCAINIPVLPYGYGDNFIENPVFAKKYAKDELRAAI